MKNRVIKEGLIYTVMVVGLALLMHPDLLSSPSVRLGLMQEKGNFFHPLLYALIIYLVIGIVRLLIGWIKKLLKKGEVTDQAK